MLPAPPELRNRMSRLDIEAQGGAGSAVLLDERNRRRPVAILGERATAAGQPLLQEVYFLERALDPYVSLTIGDRETVLTRSTAVLLVPDGASPSANDRDEIAKWIERGGIAVRFAGPNLAAGGDTLVPTPLRLGDRALGGVMSWGQPSALAEFPTNSPFLGIPVPKDVRIQQQVLAEPTPDLADKTWARLADGTPLVTAEKRGQGYLVLIHTTANTGWSNMALSGLFVNMLQRLVTLSRGVAGDGVNKALKPWRTLDGFGRLGAPPAGAQMLPADADQTFKPRPSTPPGFYGDENAQVAFNIGGHVATPKPLVLPGSVATDRLSEGGETDLARWCLLAAAILLLLDLLISLWLRGLMPRAVRIGRAARRGAAARLRWSVAAAPDTQRPEPAAARRRPGPRQARPSRRSARSRRSRARSTCGSPTSMTGDKEVDDTSKAGLEGLSEILRNRTSVEPGDPVGLDLEKDEPRLYPLIYWPITSTQPTLVAARLGGARPLPAHRRHPVHRHARPADIVRPAGRTAIPTSSACCPASRRRR